MTKRIWIIYDLLYTLYQSTLLPLAKEKKMSLDEIIKRTVDNRRKETKGKREGERENK